MRSVYFVIRLMQSAQEAMAVAECVTGGDADPMSALELAWTLRYAHRQTSDQLIEAVSPPNAYRSVFSAFAAWQQGELGTAIGQAQAGLEDKTLPALWRARALNVLAAVLSEVGLIDEALRCNAQELRQARASKDRLAEAIAVHDLGESCQVSDPYRAMDNYDRARRMVSGLPKDGDSTLGRARADEADALAAVAVLNMHSLNETYGVPLPSDTPALVDVIEQAERSHPELGVVIRAQVVHKLLDASDPESRHRARHLAGELPDPFSTPIPEVATSVGCVRSALAQSEGDFATARSVLERLEQHVSVAHVGPIHDQLIALLTAESDFQAALAVALRRADNILAVHADQSRATVRALEVWYRTDLAQERARMAEDDLAQARVAAARESLTGLWGRAHLEATAARLTGTGQIAIIDLDHFKEINDTFGHLVGDRVLQRMAKALERVCEPTDICSRYGGDEFVVLRPAARPSLADSLSELTSLEGIGDLSDGGSPGFSASIGVGPAHAATFARDFERADQAMYSAKSDGGAQLHSTTDLRQR